jgi:hypothetical protein
MPQRIGGIRAKVASTPDDAGDLGSNRDQTIMTTLITRESWRHHARSLAGAIGMAVLLAMPAGASDRVPSATTQEILIKTSLLTLNDAIVSGNFTVLHAKAAKPLREQFGPDDVKQAFKKFVEQKIDMAAIAASSPVATDAAQIDDRGALLLRGRFDVGSSRVSYKLDFVPSEGEWKPIKLNVDVKPLHAPDM